MARKKKPKPDAMPMPEPYVEFAAEHLRDRLALMKGIIPRRAVRKDYASYHFNVKPDGTATVAATSIDVRLLLNLDVLAATGTGTILIEAAALDALVGAYAEPRIRLHLGDPLLIRAEGLQTKLVLPGVEAVKGQPFVTAEPSLTKTGWVVSGSTLAGTIHRTQSCTDPGSTRYALGGLALIFPEEMEGGSLMEVVATDGRCLALSKIPVRMHGTDALRQAQPDGPASIQPPVLPCRALAPAMRLARLADNAAVGLAVVPGQPDSKGNVSGHRIQVVTKEAVLTAVIPEGRYPNFRNSFPTGEVKASFHLPDARRLGVLVRSALAGTDSESKGIEMVVAGGCLMMWTQSATRGKGQLSLLLETEGSGTFLVDAGMLMKFFTAVGSNPMELKFYTADGPLVLSSGEHYTFVIMPITKDTPPPKAKAKPVVQAKPKTEDEGGDNTNDRDGGVPTEPEEPGPVAPTAAEPETVGTNGQAKPSAGDQGKGKGGGKRTR